MPYVVGSGDPIQDVFHSSNVFVNNVPVALWLAPGTSAAFAGSVGDAPITIPPAVQAANNSTTDNYVANPSASNNPAAAANGVKPYYPGTPETGDQGDQSIPPNSSASANEIKPYLDQLLEEAKRGMWRESGQGGKPSNPNITGIWKDIGVGSSGCWTSDQTAWCMGFVNFVLKRTGYRYCSEAGARAIAAKPTRWNATQVSVADAKPGDIVLWNFSHVNFVYTSNAGKLTFVGGNQTPTAGKNNNPSDGDVSISWPSGWSVAKGGISSIWRPSKS